MFHSILKVTWANYQGDMYIEKDDARYELTLFLKYMDVVGIQHDLQVWVGSGLDKQAICSCSCAAVPDRCTCSHSYCLVCKSLLQYMASVFNIRLQSTAAIHCYNPAMLDSHEGLVLSSTFQMSEGE